MGCVTSGEALLISGGGAVTVAKAGLGRLRDRAASRPFGERELASYRSTAAFLAELGHDPEEVLGPAPVVTPRPMTNSVDRPARVRGGAAVPAV